ncbi:MAG TPA: hypothetical protein VF399_11450 [bacterium]
MKNQAICLYATSIFPIYFPGEIYRIFDFRPMEELTWKNITIIPLSKGISGDLAQGIFAYILEDQTDDDDGFFYNSLENFRRFLNFLTIRCNHAFDEISYYIYPYDKNKHGDLIYEKRLIPLVRIAGGQFYDPDIKYKIEEALKDTVKKYDNIELYNKIENALSLYRISHFQEKEGLRFILLFIALESLTEEFSVPYDPTLIDEIIENARRICNDKQIAPDSITTICSRIGALKTESNANNIIRTLEKYKIPDNDSEISIREIIRARGKFTHKGIERERLHRLSLRLGSLVKQLISKLMENINKKTND